MSLKGNSKNGSAFDLQSKIKISECDSSGSANFGGNLEKDKDVSMSK
jgi:hypothetical protein